MSASSQTPLRPVARAIVAIDGPAGAGKSTIARHVAERFGLLHLESGAMYRAFALKALRCDVPLDSGAQLEELAKETTIGLVSTAQGNRILLDGEEVTALLRDAGVTQAASRVSVHPAIRAWMVSMQQQLGAQGGVVMEGRDIGTVVFPHAEVKIFLDADPEVRGLRRYEQLGPDSSAKSEDVLTELRARDKRDRNRLDSPLKPASDAVVLDSTNLTLDQVIEQAEAIVRARLAGCSPTAD